jgi:hypothetical protein
MIVAPVETQHLHTFAGQLAGTGHAAKAHPDNYDFFHLFASKMLDFSGAPIPQCPPAKTITVAVYQLVNHFTRPNAHYFGRTRCSGKISTSTPRA